MNSAQEKNTYQVVSAGLVEYCDANQALIRPDARLREDLGLSWDCVDDFFASICDWSPFVWVPGDLDYWSICRGLDRHFESPYRKRYARERARFLRRWCFVLGRWPVSSAKPAPLEPLTVSDVARIVDARRYVSPQPIAHLEETVMQYLRRFSRRYRGEMSADTRLREDLNFDTPRFRALLVALDDHLGGCFCSSRVARTWHDAFLHWQAMKHIETTPAVTVADLIGTVRENRWTASANWQASIPGIADNHPGSEEQVFYAIRWILVEWGYEFARVSRKTQIGSKFRLSAILDRLEKIFPHGPLIDVTARERVRELFPGQVFVVDDVLQLIRSGDDAAQVLLHEGQALEESRKAQTLAHSEQAGGGKPRLIALALVSIAIWVIYWIVNRIAQAFFQ